MPKRIPPSLRKRPNGSFFVRWAGKDRYFGTDPEIAHQRYHHDETDGLPGWTRWCDQKREARRIYREFGLLTVIQLQAAFIASKATEIGPTGTAKYQSHTKRFVASYGGFLAGMIRVGHVQRLKDAMLRQGYAARTINHDITAIRTMFQWAMDLEMIQPVNLRGCRKLPLGEIPDKSMSRREVVALLDRADGQVKAWLHVAYLTGARPTEVVRVVNGEGEWIARGVFKTLNKNWRKVRMARHILFTAEAFHWLRQCRPIWKRLDSFSAACRRELGVGPHRLRHSAATHLLDRRVPRADVDEWQGRYPRGVSLTYMRPRFAYLRRLGVHLSLRK